MKIRPSIYILSVLSLGLLLCACESDDKPPTIPPVAPDTVIIGAEIFNNALTAAPAEADRGNAAVAILERAMMGMVPATAVGDRDLTTAQVGKEATFSFDINQDGTSEEIYLFTPNLDPINYLLWAKNDQCHLAWQDAGTSWLLSAPCALDETKHTIVCQNDACSRCDATGNCMTCAVSDSEVRCDALSDDLPDMGDGDASGEDMQDEDIFTPERPGECNLECVSQRGAYCCKTCGCEGEIKCDPECGTGYRWDCEVGCCFSYETFSCDCPSGTAWNTETYACEGSE